MKNTRKIALLSDVREIQKLVAKVYPARDVIVPSSPLTQLNTPGRKCDHGVYIPATSPYPDNAEYCTVCCPIAVAVREHGTHLA